VGRITGYGNDELMRVIHYKPVIKKLWKRAICLSPTLFKATRHSYFFWVLMNYPAIFDCYYLGRLIMTGTYTFKPIFGKGKALQPLLIK